MRDIYFDLISGAVIGVFFWGIVYIQDKAGGGFTLKFLAAVTVCQFLLGVFVAQVNDITLAEEFAVKTAAGSSTLRMALISLFATCTVGLINIFNYLIRNRDDE
jgi:hypothetical protein